MINTSLKRSSMQKQPTPPDKFIITLTISLGKMLKLSIVLTISSRQEIFMSNIFCPNLKF